jgi:hypothetical protein
VSFIFILEATIPRHSHGSNSGSVSKRRVVFSIDNPGFNSQMTEVLVVLMIDDERRVAEWRERPVE